MESLHQMRKSRAKIGVFWGRRGAGFEIGFDPASPEASIFAKATMDKPPRQVGFVWLCFCGVGGDEHFHNPLLILYLRSFGHLVNWVCFGFVLALYWLCIGFDWVCFCGVRGDEHFRSPLL